jgi:hypothetical protein
MVSARNLIGNMLNFILIIIVSQMIAPRIKCVTELTEFADPHACRILVHVSISRAFQDENCYKFKCIL